ncbi:hypothetical protein OAL67_01115 [bacterium]|nr:hypothetical protein [bacterium]
MKDLFVLVEKLRELNNSYNTTFSGTGSNNSGKTFSFENFTVSSVSGEVISMMERLKNQYTLAID